MALFMKKKRKVFFQKTVSVITGLFLVFQSLTPGFFISSKSFAQEAPVETPTPTVVPAPEQPNNNEVTPTPEIVAPTPSEEVSPTPLVEPSVTVTPEPSQEPSPTIEPQKEEPSNTPSDPPKEASPPETPPPTENPTPFITPEPTPEEIEQTCEQPSETRTTSDYDWSINEFAGTAETRNPVELGVNYVFPKNTNVSVTFTCLPKDTSKRTALKIEEVAISELKLPDGINSTTNYAYDITTGMQDGTFKYNVTLPKSDKDNVGVSYIEKSVGEVKSASLRSEDVKTIEQNITTENGNIKASEIDHFTIFIATYGNTSYTVGTEKTQYARGETVYVHSTIDGSNVDDKYYRLYLNPPSGSDISLSNCQKVTSNKTINGSSTLSSYATTGTWSAELRRYTNNSCTNNQTTVGSYSFTVTSVYDHIDIRIASTYNVTVGSTTYPITGIVQGDNISVNIINAPGYNTTYTIPKSGFDASENEYRKTGITLPSTLGMSNFQISATVVLDKAYITARPTLVSLLAGLYNGTNYVITVTNYVPTANVCTGGGTGTATGYDFIISQAVTAQITGNLNVIKTVVPSTDPGVFDLLIGGTEYASNVGNGGQTGAQTVTAGTVTFSETAGTGTNLSNYTTTYSAGCENGQTTVAVNETKTCTITNTRKPYCGDGIINGSETCDGVNLGGLPATDFKCTACSLGLIDDKVTICHAADSQTNPYNQQKPNKSADVSGHDYHDGVIWYPGIADHAWGDIIPPFYYIGGYYSGQNWTADGQAIWNNGCAIPKGTLIVKKTVINDNGGTKSANDFSFRVNGGTITSFETDGQNDLSLDPNTYTVTETPVSGYDITYSNCSDISLGAGQTKTCTITNNDISPKITVTKIVNGSSEPVSSFPLFVKDLTHTYPVNSGQQYSINAGIWTVTETNKTGYTATITGDCAANGTITLNPGDVKACTITNSRDTGVVTFEKLVDDGSSVFGWLFTVKDGNGTTIGTYHNGDTATLPTGTYTVTESGATHYSFQGAAGICTANPTTGINSMNVTKSGGTCTFTNVYVPYCGDGMKNRPSEQCDDGNSVNTDACTNGCLNPTCGDGYVYSGVEECDNGAANTSSCTPPYGGSCNYCDAATCVRVTITGPFCGDGHIDTGEQCDDTNTTSGDGCSATCQEEPGTITFIKDANPHSTQGFYFNYEANPYEIGDFILKDDNDGDTSDRVTFTAIPAGTYAWREDTTLAGWNLTNISCQESKTANSTTNINFGRANIILEPGENVTCTFTNTKNGTVVIEKQTVPDGSTQSFRFNPSWSIGDFFLTDGQQRTQSVTPGAYAVDEIVPTGWTLTNVSCSDANSGPSVATTGATINVEAGETVTCIFTNTRDTGTIELKKAWAVTADQTTLNIGSSANGSDIASQLTGTNGTAPLTTGTVTVPTGTYYVSEAGGLDTYQSELSCLDNGEEIEPTTGNAITVAQNHAIICTFINTRKTYPLFVTKFEDGNGNATQDTGELPLDGWTMELYDNSDCSGSPSASAVTSSDITSGTAKFDGLHLGQTYWVKEVEQSPDWVNTTGNCVAATIHDDIHSNNTVSFGNFKYGVLSGYKFRDLNNNHELNEGESYLPEWAIRIYKSNNDGGWNHVATTNTNTDGVYEMKGLNLGTYKACEVMQNGWTQTYPTTGLTRENSDEAQYCHEFAITASGQTVSKDFGNIDTGDMIVTKFEDLNGNGVWDKDTEETLNGWEMNVYGQTSQVTGSGDNKTGQAAFNRLTQGTYYLSETGKEGWKQTGIYCQNSGPGTTITKEGEAYGHHGNCGGWNGCGDAKTCAQWACEINGYTTLVSYGADKQCTQFNNCHLFYSRGSIQWNWGNWCEVQGVTDIVCTGRSTTMQNSESSVASSTTHKSIFPIEQVNAQESSGYPVTVTAGGQTNCYIGNQYIPAKLEVSKENNATTTLSPGSSVLYTLTVTAHDNAAYGVKLTDLLPKGFVYRAGSWTASSDTHGALALSEPTYHSPGTWDIGTIEKDEVITLTLLADIATDEKPGTYKDLALAYGCQRNGDCELGGTNSITASAIDPGQLNDIFVGTEVTVVKDQQDSKTLTVNHEEKIEGSVLGATTDLPSTGANSNWIVLAISLMVTGLGAIVVANKMRRYHA